MNKLIAHIRQDESDEWQIHSLLNHLHKVAELAERFANGRGDVYAKQSGLWHDLGKAQADFQTYIKNASGFDKENAHIEGPGRVPHSAAGAKYAVNQLDSDSLIGMILAYLIAGHHAGLADWEGKGSLKQRLDKADQELAAALAAELPESLLEVDTEQFTKAFPVFLSENFFENVHIWLRFLFSCLVDADFLDTEAFMNGFANADAAKAGGIRPTFPDLAELNQRYECCMQQLAASAVDTPLNRERQVILQQCLEAARLDKTLFSLTVPTGGGKTLASLGFALKHALTHGKKRIIYAIPFTSIIEQNATVFRKALGDKVVLEHHSNLDGAEDKETAKGRLATENWDAPLIVTTNVQLFESLFAARTSRCRKIHNIADSVIVLDEAQQIPRDFQKPITDMMRELAANYGVSFVLCTATQPELGRSENAFGRVLLQGLPQAHEIMQDKIGLAERLRRVHIRLPENNDIKQSWQQVADEIAARDCVLAVVNTRAHAKKLFAALPDKGVKLHLSANMCAAHRSEIIALVRLYLKAYRAGKLTQPLWLVSTQLVEAGVDLDFPVVYRAMAGLDSIAQAAGRCNREGKLPDGQLGEVVVFRPEDGAPSGSLKQGADITEEMLAGGLLDEPLSPTAFAEYFKRFNAKGEVDKHGITGLLTAECSAENPLAINFRTAAERFRLIDNNGIPLVVSHIPLVHQAGERVGKTVSAVEMEDFLATQLADIPQQNWLKEMDRWRYPQQGGCDRAGCDRELPQPFEKWFTILKNDASARWVYRKLQRYTITVPESRLKQLSNGAVYERAGLLVLDKGYYRQELGADFDNRVLPPQDSEI